NTSISNRPPNAQVGTLHTQGRSAGGISRRVLTPRIPRLPLASACRQMANAQGHPSRANEGLLREGNGSRQTADYVRTNLRLARRALALAGRLPWLAFFKLRWGLAMGEIS